MSFNDACIAALLIAAALLTTAYGIYVISQATKRQEGDK